jgi:hypothetical protein
MMFNTTFNNISVTLLQSLTKQYFLKNNQRYMYNNELNLRIYIVYTFFVFIGIVFILIDQEPALLYVAWQKLVITGECVLLVGFFC